MIVTVRLGYSNGHRFINQCQPAEFDVADLANGKCRSHYLGSMNNHLANLLIDIGRSVEMPLVIAHRGASAVAPENTLTAFDSAITQGADAIEFDVRPAADLTLVAYHDATLDRCSNGCGLVRHHDLQELKQLDAGTWFGSRFAGERIPTLTEALAVMAGCVIPIIEVKMEAEEDPIDMVDSLIGSLDALDLRHRAIISSFDIGLLEELNEEDCELKLALAVKDSSTRAPPWITGWHPTCETLTEKQIQIASKADQWVLPWTVNEVTEINRIIADGADGIITDAPQAARAALADA